MLDLKELLEKQQKAESIYHKGLDADYDVAINLIIYNFKDCIYELGELYSLIRTCKLALDAGEIEQVNRLLSLDEEIISHA